MSLMAKVNGLHFRLASGMNLRKEEIKDIMALWLFSNRLRQAIYQSDLTGHNYKVLVAELRAHWQGAVGTFKRKAMGEGVKQDDTSQTLVVAKQVRKIVEAYFDNHPSALKDAKTMQIHIYLNSIFVVESIFEVQNDLGRSFAKYVLSDSVDRVGVDELFFIHHGEAVLDLSTSELRTALELEWANNKKHIVDNKKLKSEVEVLDNMRGQLKNSKAGKELAVQEVEECRETIRALKRQVYDRDDQIEEQREQYEGKLKAVEAKNAELEREIKRLRKRKAADVED
jgi:hypothetical protein